MMMMMMMMLVTPKQSQLAEISTTGKKSPVAPSFQAKIGTCSAASG